VTPVSQRFFHRLLRILVQTAKGFRNSEDRSLVFSKVFYKNFK